MAACDGQLKNFDLRWYPDAALTVVMRRKVIRARIKKAQRSKD